MSSHSFRDLIVWQRSMELTTLVYQFISKLPSSEDFALSSQMRRCAVSVPSNIAEGQKRDSTKEFKRFLSIARGSIAELETQLEIAHRIYELDTKEICEECDTISRMLTKLMRSVSD